MPQQSEVAEPRKPSTSRTALYIVGAALTGALLLLAAAGVVHVARGKGFGRATGDSAAEAAKPAATLAKPAATSAPRAEEPKPGCTVRTAARRVRRSVHRFVPSMLGTTNDGVAIAFASDESTAIGIVIDPTTLAAQDKQPQLGRPVLSTVVLPSGEFAVVRDDFPMVSATAVAAPTPFVLGQLERHVARAHLERPRPVLEWRNVGTITPPSVASVGSTGYVVTFRAGGATGKVLFGRLDENGKAAGKLDTVTREDALVGTPTVAASATGALIAFAARPDDQAKWSLALARVAPNEAPSAAVRFEVPAGGPGGNVMSPAIAALESGRWLLQWTEGETGAYRVRTGLYATDLTPIGEPVTVSPEGLNAGQGSALATRDGALLVFVGAGSTTDELWAVSLRCQSGA
jgi:hypothetical protein